MLGNLFCQLVTALSLLFPANPSKQTRMNKKNRDEAKPRALGDKMMQV